MPKFYLLRSDSSYSDFGDYPEVPPTRIDGVWTEGDPTNLELFTEQSLADQLDAVFSQQSLDLQAQFSPLRTSINLELSQERYAVAKRVIELAQIPEELEAERTSLLNLFPQ